MAEAVRCAGRTAAAAHPADHDLTAAGFVNSVGPGVYDIHSPRVPGVEEMAASLREALKSVPAERLWVNPDCGLKTRTTDEVTPSLQHLVAAAIHVRG